ncbi:MAG TPA: hypothetical protein VM686_05575 [Polyangiaceae bacterium]|jgi:hypothetical protein|nr:hypothetical protein [Polyangiaceae bacterium]
MTDELELMAARLDDYVRGQGDDEAVDGYEVDLFERALAGVAPELSFRHQLRRSLRELDGRGSLSLWLTRSEVEKLCAAGKGALLDTFDQSEPVPNIPDGIELFIMKIPLELGGVRRLDVEVYSADGALIKHMPEVTFDPADNAIYACCEADLARTAASSRTISRFYATDDAGRRLLLETPL